LGITNQLSVYPCVLSYFPDWHVTFLLYFSGSLDASGEKKKKKKKKAKEEVDD